MNPKSPTSLARKTAGQNVAQDLSRELRQQLSALSSLSQWALLPVLILTTAGLWGQVYRPALGLWAGAACLQCVWGFINSRINLQRPEPPQQRDGFLWRNSLYFSYSAAVWGMLPMLAALFGSERANWFALIIAMAMMTAYVLVLSTSHRIFYCAHIVIGSLVLMAITIGPLHSASLLLLGLIYLVALLMMHHLMFQTHLDRVHSSLNNAAQASALAETLQHHDRLTGLYNQSGLKQWLRQLPGNDDNYRNVTIALANLKGFSEINVLHGSSVADTLLVEVATRLVARSEDNFGLARLGGAEFVLADARPDSDPEDLAQILASLEHEDFMIDGRLVNISLQLSSVQGNAEDIDLLIEIARSRLQLHRLEANAVRPEHAEKLRLNRDLVMNFHDALYGEAISAWFQPIVGCSHNTILGWEALVRWQHPDHGIILPEDFLDIARISGLATQLTRKIFRESVRFAHELSELGFAAASRISINFTASDLASPDTLEWMQGILEEYSVEPAQISVEISEKEALVQNTQFKHNLRQFRQQGIVLAIDDFGTGYANISHLLDLPASTVKLDKRFVDKLPHDKHSVALVRAIITMAQSMDMLTIAEGVERLEQLMFLRENGCDAYQGFLAGLAVPARDASGFIREWSANSKDGGAG